MGRAHGVKCGGGLSLRYGKQKRIAMINLGLGKKSEMINEYKGMPLKMLSDPSNFPGGINGQE